MELPCCVLTLAVVSGMLFLTPFLFFSLSLHALGTTSACTQPKVVFITGVNGMIGAHLARFLVSSRTCYSIYGLVRYNSNVRNLDGFTEDIHLIKGDLMDASRIDTIIGDLHPDFIYHFGAQAINGISYDIPELTLDVNMKGTLHVLQSMVRHGLHETRLVFAGSSTEYGLSVTEQPISEDSPLQPISPYGVSKAAAEMLILQYSHKYNLSVVLLRFFIQIGKGGTDSLSIQSFCKQIAYFEANPSMLPVLSHGNLYSMRDISDVEDMMPFIVELGENTPSRSIYNVGTGKGVMIYDLLQEALRQSTIPIRLLSDVSRQRSLDEKILVANISRMQSHFPQSIPTLNISKTVGKILLDWRRRTLFA